MTTPLGSGAPPDWVAHQVYPIGVAVVHAGVLYRAIAVNDNDAPPSASWTAVLSGGGGGTPGGSDGQFQYNNATAFGGSAELTRVPAGVNPSSVTLTGVGGSHGAFGSALNMLAALNDADDTEPSLFVSDPASGGEVSLILATSLTDVDAWSGLRLKVSGGATPSVDIANEINGTLGAGTVVIHASDLNFSVVTSLQVNGSSGATGTFTTADAKTVTVKHGLITSIV